MRNIWLIARREYLEQVKGRAFRLMTVLLPCVIGGMIWLLDRVNGGGRHSHSHGFGNTSIDAAYLMAMMLTTAGVVYGLNVGRSIIAEKTSRIFEVLLASVRPDELMFGKLIGVGSVGLTQIAIWIAMGTIFIASSYSKQLLGGGLTLGMDGFKIFLFCLFFLLGYLFYSALSAGMAATVSTEQELQQMMPINAIPVWLSFGMIPYITTHPDSGWALALSLIPPISPITIFLRMGEGPVPMWQIAASVGIMALTICAMIWFASRLYRMGILMYGKRATLPEILHWIRHS
jgi:ABC-2 type transport system permease protein